MHEIKKDNQRIFAGLSKLLLDKNVAEYVEGHELAEMIVRINEKYAEMLEKDIRFSKHIEGEHLHTTCIQFYQFLITSLQMQLKQLKIKVSLLLSYIKEINIYF